MAVNPIKDIILDLFSDNSNGDITASDMRQFVDGIWEDKERKINKYKTLNNAFQDTNLYQLDIFIIVEEIADSKNGIYVSLINQPNNEADIAQVANLTKNDVFEVQTYTDMLNISANKGDICTVIDDVQTYIYNGNNWAYFLSYETIREGIKDNIVSDDSLWSSQKISDYITNISNNHVHSITDITNLENILLNIEQNLSEKLENKDGKGSGNFKIFDNNGSSLEILNTPDTNAIVSKSLLLEPNSLSITNYNEKLQIINDINESYISITENAIQSKIITLKAGEAPKTQYVPILDDDITNKNYVDTKFSNIPDITNFATKDYVDIRDLYKVNKAGDVMTGALNIVYGSTNTGIIIQNSSLMEPYNDWMITNSDTKQLQIRKRNNYNLQDNGIIIDDNAHLLELYDKLYYDTEEMATVQYVQDQNILQDVFIASKVSKSGDVMTGKLISAGLETSLGTNIRLQEYQYSNSPVIEYAGITYNSFGTGTPGFSNPSIIFNLEDSIGNDVGVFPIDLVIKSQGTYHKVWTSDNDGVDSGLDADKLDGMEPIDLPINIETVAALDLKYDKTGGIISGNVSVQGNIETLELTAQNVSSNALSVHGISTLNKTNINDDVFINNNKSISVSGIVYANDMQVSGIPEFNDNIIIGKSLNDNPKIIFYDDNTSQEVSLAYDKTTDELLFTSDAYIDSKIYHEDNLDVYEKFEHINSSIGPNDANKPIVLNSNGKIDPSMLDVSVFYYVGSWTPNPYFRGWSN